MRIVGPSLFNIRQQVHRLVGIWLQTSQSVRRINLPESGRFRVAASSSVRRLLHEPGVAQILREKRSRYASRSYSVMPLFSTLHACNVCYSPASSNNLFRVRRTHERTSIPQTRRAADRPASAPCGVSRVDRRALGGCLPCDPDNYARHFSRPFPYRQPGWPAPAGEFWVGGLSWRAAIERRGRRRAPRRACPAVP